MNELNKYNEKAFENIKHIDESGYKYWLARELMNILQYRNRKNFEKIINKAIMACKNSNFNIVYHFIDVSKMIQIAKGAKRKVLDYKLSRYACYLIAQNGDSRKSVIALAQTYFAIQTRKQEIDKFHNAGYEGLYNGETADDIAKRKHLRYREDILDNMGSEELVDNLFRITHTEQKLKRDNIIGEKSACITHKEIGKIVRNAIKEAGGRMPEDLPTPKKSLKELEKENKNNLIL